MAHCRAAGRSRIGGHFQKTVSEGEKSGEACFTIAVFTTGAGAGSAATPGPRILRAAQLLRSPTVLPSMMERLAVMAPALKTDARLVPSLSGQRLVRAASAEKMRQIKIARSDRVAERFQIGLVVAREGGQHFPR